MTSWRRTSVGLSFNQGQGPDGVYLTNLERKEQVTDGLSVNSNRELNFRAFNRVPEDIYYWSLPPQFLGDKVTAYGGKLRFTLSFRPGRDNSPLSMKNPLVQIGGNELVLLYKATKQLMMRGQSFEVPFIETDWVRMDGAPVNREGLLMALADLEFVLVRASWASEMSSSTIKDISMDIAEDRDTGESRAFAVEHSNCPVGYLGLSCQDCAPGYTRTGGGLYLGLCEPCQCNGHSNNCDPETGVCRNCQHNTEGDKCELCSRGYYGNATRGSSSDCQMCPCPLTESPNQFSPDCELDPADGQVTCLSCPVGHIGRRCERCAEGYEGNPMRPGDYCKNQNRTCECNPSGTIPNTLCDPDTQQCQCKAYVQGLRCSTCQEGYFNLNQDNDEGCLKCFCMGIATQCTSSNYFRDEIRPKL
jgi:dystroglycan 1